MEFGNYWCLSWRLGAVNKPRPLYAISDSSLDFQKILRFAHCWKIYIISRYRVPAAVTYSLTDIQIIHFKLSCQWIQLDASTLGLNVPFLSPQESLPSFDVHPHCFKWQQKTILATRPSCVSSVGVSKKRTYYNICDSDSKLLKHDSDAPKADGYDIVSNTQYLMLNLNGRNT